MTRRGKIGEKGSGRDPGCDPLELQETERGGAGRGRWPIPRARCLYVDVVWPTLAANDCQAGESTKERRRGKVGVWAMVVSGSLTPSGRRRQLRKRATTSPLQLRSMDMSRGRRPCSLSDSAAARWPAVARFSSLFFLHQATPLVSAMTHSLCRSRVCWSRRAVLVV